MTKEDILEALPVYSTKEEGEEYTEEEIRLIEIGYGNCLKNLTKVLDVLS